MATYDPNTDYVSGILERYEERKREQDELANEQDLQAQEMMVYNSLAKERFNKASPADYESFLERGDTGNRALSRLDNLYGTPMPPPRPGFKEGFMSGVSYGHLGNTEDGTGWNTIGDLTGVMTNIIGTTIAAKRALGLNASLTRLGAIKEEIITGLMADISYSALDTTDDNALTYGAMLGANLVLPAAMGTKMFTKFDHLGQKIEQRFLSNVDNATNNIDDIIVRGDGEIEKGWDISDRYTNPLADEKFDVPINLSERTKYATQGEYRVASMNKYTREHRARVQEYDTIRNEETAKIINKPGNAVELRKAQQARVDELLAKQKVLDPEKQEMLNNVLKETVGERGWKNYINGSHYKGIWSDVGTDKTSTKKFGRELNQLKRDLEVMEENMALGLPANAGKRERNSVLNKIEKVNRDVLKRMSKDEFLQRSSKGYMREYDLFTKDAESTALSMRFIKSQEFQKDFVDTVAYWDNVDDPLVKREAAYKAIEYLNKYGDQIEKKLASSLGHAFGNPPLELQDVAKLQELIRSGKAIDSSQYDSLRPKLAKFITRTLEDYIDVPSRGNAAIRQELAEFSSKIKESRTAGDEAAVAVAQKQRSEIKKQYIKQLITDPNQVKQYVDETGDFELAEAIDIYYASLGDIDSTNRLLMRGNQDIIRGQTAEVTTRLAKDPDNYTTGGSATPPSQNGILEAPKDLNMIRRLFGTISINLENSIKRATKEGNVHTVKVLKKVHAWTRKMEIARESFLTDMQEFTTKYLQPFYHFAKSRGTQFEANVYAMTDEVAIKADEMLRAGQNIDDVENWISSYVRELSPEMKTAYKLFRETTDELFFAVNHSIREHNALVRAGQKVGQVMEEVKYRPGYTPYFYEGSYKLQYRGAGGAMFTHIVETRKEAVDMLKRMNSDGELPGHIVLEPLMFDDASGFIQFTSGGMSMEDAFGISGRQLNELLSKRGGLTTDNLHDVFWGAKLQRRLSLADQKMGTEASMALASRFAYRFKNYAPLVQEGNTLVKELRDLGLHNWSDAIRVYGDDLLGRSRNAEKTFEKVIRNTIDDIVDKIPVTSALFKAMGVSSKGRIVRAFSEGLTMLGRMLALGFNPASALIQWFILPTNVAPVIGFKNAAAGLKQLAKVRNEPWFKSLMQKGGLHINPANIGLAERLDLPKALASKTQRMRNFLDWTSMYMFNAAETNIRAASMLGARQHAKQMIKAGGNKSWQWEMLNDIGAELGKRIDHADVLDEYAVRIMKKTNFDFDITGLSEIARNPLLKPFAQFKTYFFKEIEFLMGGVPLSAKERFISLGMFGAIGGMFAIPGADEIDQWSTSIFGISPKVWVMNNMPEVFGAGLGATIGLDFSQKANIGTLSRALSPEGIWGVAPSKAAYQYKQYAKGNLSATDAFLGSFSVMKGIGQAIELQSTGRVSDQYDQTLVHADDLNMVQKIGIGMGISPTPMSKAITATRYKHVQEKRQSARDRAALRDYVDAYFERDYATANEIAKKNELSKAQIDRAIKKRRQTAGDVLREGMSKKVQGTREGQATLDLVDEY